LSSISRQSNYNQSLSLQKWKRSSAQSMEANNSCKRGSLAFSNNFKVLIYPLIGQDRRNPSFSLKLTSLRLKNSSLCSPSVAKWTLITHITFQERVLRARALTNPSTIRSILTLFQSLRQGKIWLNSWANYHRSTASHQAVNPERKYPRVFKTKGKATKDLGLSSGITVQKLITERLSRL